MTAGTLAHGVLDSLGLLLGPLSYLTAGRRANRKKKSDGEIADANGLHETIHASRKFAIAKDLARVQEEFATMMAALPANSRAKTWLTDIQSMNQIGDVAEMLRILNEKI